MAIHAKKKEQFKNGYHFHTFIMVATESDDNKEARGCGLGGGSRGWRPRLTMRNARQGQRVLRDDVGTPPATQQRGNGCSDATTKRRLRQLQRWLRQLRRLWCSHMIVR